MPHANAAGQNLRGESALFALARAKMAAAQAPAESVSSPTTPAASPVQRMSAAPAEPPQKILRPGSLLDIRV